MAQLDLQISFFKIILIYVRYKQDSADPKDAIADTYPIFKAHRFDLGSGFESNSDSDEDTLGIIPFPLEQGAWRSWSGSPCHRGQHRKWTVNANAVILGISSM